MDYITEDKIELKEKFLYVMEQDNNIIINYFKEKNEYKTFTEFLEHGVFDYFFTEKESFIYIGYFIRIEKDVIYTHPKPRTELDNYFYEPIDTRLLANEVNKGVLEFLLSKNEITSKVEPLHVYIKLDDDKTINDIVLISNSFLINDGFNKIVFDSLKIENRLPKVEL
jgi:hypothetical protein